MTSTRPGNTVNSEDSLVVLGAGSLTESFDSGEEWGDQIRLTEVSVAQRDKEGVDSQFAARSEWSFREAQRLLGIHSKNLHRLVRNLNLNSDIV